MDVPETEGRNFEAVLDQPVGGRLRVSDLVMRSFSIGEAGAAYRLIEQHTEPCLAIRLTYLREAADEGVRLRRSPAASTSPESGGPG